MKKTVLLLLTIKILSSCTSFIKQDSLSKSDLEYIAELGLLDTNEKILIFSSSLTTQKSGNFLTDKRIASYWFDQDTSKSYIESALYSDIIKLDSVNLSDAWTYNSYLLVTRKDKVKFKVYIAKDQYHKFAKTAFDYWQKQ
ncbi:hypothetical protein [Marinifilum caeruleilacunae]|uniref:Lipoprotein n=1 Tax=Marinifilum caeruleilacunae TaxID=2499076 RepID=A0ABX1WR14_9BACT|nr:hypothetical protein [Marinifilum caeruleilacunae]NOU58503.1 hypothetical protein [Marinifilum caeruleilacunae]